MLRKQHILLAVCIPNPVLGLIPNPGADFPPKLAVPRAQVAPEAPSNLNYSAISPLEHARGPCTALPAARVQTNGRNLRAMLKSGRDQRSERPLDPPALLSPDIYQSISSKRLRQGLQIGQGHSRPSEDAAVPATRTGTYGPHLFKCHTAALGLAYIRYPTSAAPGCTT